MPVVKVEPTDAHPVPYDTSEMRTDSLLDEIAVAGNTAELQMALGAGVDTDPETLEKEALLVEAVVRKQARQHLKNLPTAVAAASFLREYGQQMAMDVAEVRTAITNKLMEIANCGDAKYELKALELLGKHSDIGLFTERSEITINYKSPEELENAIKERVKRLMNADIIDVTPIGVDLDEELGVAGLDMPDTADAPPEEADDGGFVDEDD